MRAAGILAPIGFVAANLIIYWSGFDTIWKIGVAIALGLAVFTITRLSSSNRRPLDWAGSVWVWPWLVGTVLIGWLGRYDSGLGKDRAHGKGELFLLPAWIDLLVVISIIGTAHISAMIFHKLVRNDGIFETMAPVLTHEQEAMLSRDRSE